MPIEVIEENQQVAQVRVACDYCGVYIGTRIVLKSDLEAKKVDSVCPQCRKEPKLGL